MDENDVLFDRLAGGVLEYVKNYYLSKIQSFVTPSYDVDYEVSQEILFEIEKSIKKNIDDIWYHQISNCKNINDLPYYLQSLIIQYLPRFLKQYPQYENHKNLQIK